MVLDETRSEHHVAYSLFEISLQETLRLRRILDMEETSIMNISFSFVHGMAIDDQNYIDRLTGNVMMRTH